MTQIFIIQCPSCGKVQNYIKRNKTDISKQRKTCINCSKAFKIHGHITNSTSVLNKTNNAELVKEIIKDYNKGHDFISYK